MAQANRQQQIMQYILGVSLFIALIGGYFTIRYFGNPSADTLTTTASPVTFTVAATHVAPGDPVVFTINNATGSDLTLTSSAPYTVTRAGSVIYAPFATQVVESISNGRQHSWTWNQQSDNGKQVLPGTYTVTLRYTQHQISQTATVTVTIDDPTAPIHG